MGNNNYNKYDEDFKKSLVSLRVNPEFCVKSLRNLQDDI